MSIGTPKKSQQPESPITTQGTQNFLKKGEPPIALFELAQILFIYGRQSNEFQTAWAKRLREQGGKKLWK